MNLTRKLLSYILLAILAFFAGISNVISYLGIHSLINLVCAILDAVLLYFILRRAYNIAKYIDERLTYLTEAQESTLDILTEMQTSFILITEVLEESVGKVCRLENNSVTLQSKDKGSPSPTE